MVMSHDVTSVLHDDMGRSFDDVTVLGYTLWYSHVSSQQHTKAHGSLLMDSQLPFSPVTVNQQLVSMPSAQAAMTTWDSSMQSLAEWEWEAPEYETMLYL